MFRNYFITAFRNLIRNKIQSIIQVISLAIGITSAILIGIYARYELSYDRFNENYNRIYRVEFNDAVGQHTALGHRIKQEFSEVQNVVRLVNWTGKDYSTPAFIPSKDPGTDGRIVHVEDFFACDSTIFDVFTFDFIQGDPKTALKDPYSIVFTESAARKIFGEKDPIGEDMGFWGSTSGYTVTGIVKDFKNSHLEINMLVSIVSFDTTYGFSRDDPEYLNNYVWGACYMTYLLLPEHVDPSYIEERINDFFKEDWQVNRPQIWGKGFTLRPLKDVYFATGLMNELNYCRHGNLKQLYALLTIAVFILVIAIINYVNLTTARASLRAKEVGIRKVTGSSKSVLVSQFLVESIVVALISFLMAITLVQLLLPGFNRMASTDLEMSNLSTPGIWVVFLISVIILGIISGMYPAFYMTGFQPVKSLSGIHTKGTGKVLFRQVLLTFQFIISVVLIFGVFVILRQLHYMKSANLGFNKELIINPEELSNWVAYDFLKVQYIREQFLKNPNIKGATFSGTIIGGEQDFTLGDWEINGIKRNFTLLSIDPDYFDVMEIKIVDGRNLSWDRQGDNARNAGNQYKIIVNETFVREYEIESPVGYSFKNTDGSTFEIIGVVSDFHYQSLKQKIEPTVYFWGGGNFLHIRIAPIDIPGTIKYINKVCQSAEEHDPYWSGRYSFLDETFDKQYRKDEQTAKIIANFAIVAILIACLGLFGLSSFMAVRRTKEIGIRKAMGASVQSVFLMLSREFIKWVILSVVIACPVAWFVMNKWLQSFAYRTNISWWIFALAIFIAYAIAFATVTWQSLKTARTNPVEALRYE